MGGPHGQKSVWATAHTVPAPMLVGLRNLGSVSVRAFSLSGPVAWNALPASISAMGYYRPKSIQPAVWLKSLFL